MQTEQARVTLRRREALEAVDLGFRMAREWWRPLLLSWLVFVVPFGVVLAVALRGQPWLAVLVLWWLRPAFDRVPLFVLSRALFGAASRPADVMRALPALLRSGIPTSLFVQRLSPARTFLLPVLQLEGLRGQDRRARCSVLAMRDIGAAAGLLFVGAHMNLAVLIGLLLGVELLVPEAIGWDVFELFDLDGEGAGGVLIPLLYLCGVSLVEPLMVAGGFALYLNRRVYLEGWDIDLAFRRLAGRVEADRLRRGGLRAAAGVGLVLLALLPAPTRAEERCISEDPVSAAGCVERVFQGPDFGRFEEQERWQLRDFGESDEDDSERLAWLGEGIARILEISLWTGLAVLAVLLVAAAARRGETGPARDGPEAARPTTAQIGPDLAPAALPQDPLGAARACWARGASVEALSLLYRGALLRLTERDGLPIPESATELECLGLVRGRLGDDDADAFRNLTLVWLRARYAAQTPDAETFEDLCVRFPSSFGSGA